MNAEPQLDANPRALEIQDAGDSLVECAVGLHDVIVLLGQIRIKGDPDHQVGWRTSPRSRAKRGFENRRPFERTCTVAFVRLPVRSRRARAPCSAGVASGCRSRMCAEN